MFFGLIQSFYYQSTFLPPISLTEDQLQKWKLDDGSEKAVQKQFEEPTVRKYFTSPLILNYPEFETCVRDLQDKGWKVLSEKPLMVPGQALQLKPYYSVIERDELPGVIIKHGGLRKPEEARVVGGLFPTGDTLDFNQYCSLFRIAMIERIQEACQRHPQELVGITLPDKHLCEITPNNHDLPVEKRFVIVAQKIDCLNIEETVGAIDIMPKLEQEALADKLALLVKETGLADASFSNIRLGKPGDNTPDGVRRIYILDTEPSNLMILDNGMKNRFLTQQSSVEKSARIGIHALKQMDLKGETSKAPHFQARLAERAEEISTSQYSTIRIGAHLISIIAMGALYKHYGTRKWKVGLVITVLAPVEVGTARWLGALVCGIVQIIKQKQLVIGVEEQHRIQWWGYYSSWFIGEGRVFITPEQIEQMRRMGLA